MSAVPAAVAATGSAASNACFHCGLPVPADTHWHVEIDRALQPMCCPGCEAVAQAIVDHGLADYYRTRSEFPAGADRDALNPSLIPSQLALYDTPEAIAGFSTDAESCEAVFSIDGIRCAACVWLIEKRLSRVDGLLNIDMNVATGRLGVRWQAERCKPSHILSALHEIGYAAYPFDAVRHGEQLRLEGRKMFRRLFIAGLSMMQVMMYAAPAYFAGEGGIEADMESLMRWASLLLTAPAVFYSAQPFFKGAWAGIRLRALGMDVPVALGIAAAFAGSAAATWRGHGDVYFDSVTMFIFLLLGSRYLELLSRRKAASSLEKMQRALPASALRMDGYPACRDTELVAASLLRENDVLLVRPGEAIAADGVIIEGGSAIDVSLLSGESRPLPKVAGDAVPGGAVNAAQAIVMRVTRPARDSTLSMLMKLVERAAQAKPQLALWADQVAAWFVAALLLLALGVFFYWQWHDAARAWPIAIAVLVVSCPCALSLATPTALAAATDRLIRQGVLVARPHVLETLQRATHIVFDKTGTLTLGKPALREVQAWNGASRTQCLQIAAALEAGSAHPLAAAIIEAAANETTDVPIAARVRHAAGEGIEGQVDGVPYRLGNAAFVGQLSGSPPADRVPDGVTPVYLGAGHRWLARFDLVDALRADAREVIDHFRAQRKTVILLSGDHHGVTRRVADELGIERAHGECLPERKLAFVQDLQREGAVVAMIGDGINDAAVLSAVDVSFAMGSGAALAQVHADAVLMSGRLSSLKEAARTASHAMGVVRQNLAWATLYNAIAIPAAAVGLLNPWLSGIGMSLSSAVVVANALRLRRLPRSSASSSALLRKAVA